MNHQVGVRVVALDVAACELALETTWQIGQAPSQHVVQLSPGEVPVFGAVLGEHPFGAGAEHFASIQHLSTRGATHTCGIRLSKDGSRVLRTVQIGHSTYAALKRVLDTNIVSDGYVPE